MKRYALSSHLTRIGPEERFKLIYRANARGDERERDALVRTSPALTLMWRSHALHAFAFSDLSFHFYLKVLEASQCFLDREQDLIRLILQNHLHDHSRNRSQDLASATETPKPSPTPAPPIPRPTPGQRVRSAKSQQLEGEAVDLLMAEGCVLRQMVLGWVRFCRGFGVPPFAHWKKVTGFPRILAAIRRSRDKAFSPTELSAWIHQDRPNNEPPPSDPSQTEHPWTAENVTAIVESCYREYVAKYGGACEPPRPESTPGGMCPV